MKKKDLLGIRWSLLQVVSVLVATGMFYSCSRKTVPPPAPPPLVEEPRIELPGYDTAYVPIKTSPMTSIYSISEIQLPVTIDSDALIRQVNLLVPTELYNDTDFTDDRMKIRALKMDSVQLRILPNKLMYDVPFKLFIERDITISTIKAEGALRVFFNTDYKVNTDWSFSTKTTVVRHEWIEKPKLRLGPVNIGIETIANKLMGNSADLICKQIDAQLQDGFKLRDYVDQAWRKIQQPIEITDKPQLTWLMIQPEKIMMVPLNTESGQVKTSLVFRSKTDIQFGNKPDIPYLGILPTFEEISTLSKDSTIQLKINFPLDRAEKLLRDYFHGQEFRDGGKVMIIDSLHVSGNGNKLHVLAFVSGSYPMTIEFEGLPVYNKDKRRFELKDLDYSVKSKNLLVKAASWILKKNLNKKLAELLVYDVGGYIDSGKQNLAASLSQFSTMGFKMKADINDVWATDPVVNGNQAEIQFLANGKFRILVEELVK